MNWRRWLGLGAILLAVAALTLAALLGWVLHSASGRDFALQQTVARLPAGTQLHWQRVDGTLAGGLTLRGLQLTMPQSRDAHCVPTSNHPCAMGTLHFDAGTMHLRVAPLALVRGHLQVNALTVSNATLDVPRDDTPFELPKWPDVLPTLEVPLPIIVESVRITRLTIQEAAVTQLSIADLHAALRLRPGALHVEHLRIASDRGIFSVHGDYAPRHHFRSNLAATAVFPAAAGSTPARLGLIARGDLSNLTVAIGGRAPAPLRATLTLHGDADAPQWTLRAHSDALDPQLLAGGDNPSTPWALQLRARGIGGRAELSGKLRRGDFNATVQPSTLRLEQRTLHLQPLVVDLLDGRVRAQGRVQLDGDDTALDVALTARQLHWRSADTATTVAGDADIRLRGTLEAWTAQGHATLQRSQQTATLQFSGHGDSHHAQLRRLQVSMPQGRLDADGRITWTPALQWNAQAQLAGFDPGYFLPDWPGAINGHIESHGQQRAAPQGLLAHINVRQLGGQLRGRRLGGQATLDIDGERYRGDTTLTLGGSRIEARGEVAQSVRIDALFAPLQLHDLLPDGRGTLRGSLKLRGARTAPDFDIQLTGNDIVFGDYHAAQLTARGQLPWQRGNGALDIEASGVQAGVALNHLHAQLRGAVERLQFNLAADGAPGKLTAQGRVQRQGQRWQGALSALHLAPTTGAVWSLQQPTHGVWDGHTAQLAATCLQSSAGGQLCAHADWPRHGLTASGTQLPLALLAPYLPDRGDGRPWVLVGDTALHANVHPVGQAWAATVALTSAQGGLRNGRRAKRDLFGYRDFKLDAQLTPHRVALDITAALNGNGTLDTHLATGWDAFAPLAGSLKLTTSDLLWVELLSPDVVSPSGQLQLDLHLAGTRAQPRLDGSGHLQHFATELPALGIALTDGDVVLTTRDDGSARIVGSARSDKGTLAVNGELNWLHDDTPLVLNIRGSDVLLADTRQLHVVVNPDLSVRYRAGTPLQVTGQVKVPEADIHLERLDMGVSASPDVVVLDPADPKRSRQSTPLELDLSLVMGDAVKMDGYGLKGTLGGELRVRASPGQAMRAIGALDIGGRYRAYGQDLRITRGRLRWANVAVEDPSLDLNAERTVGDVTAGIKVSGRASSPQLRVYSDPAMGQSEALAYLTLGRPLPSLSSKEMQQVNAAQSALNAGAGLLAAELGARLGLDDAGVSQSRALGSEVLSVGKYLSPKLYVSYGVSLLGTGQVFMLKYLLRKGFDIEIESSTLENRGSINWRLEK